MKCYRIRNGDGLYSKGGTTPFWTKKGKTWSAKQHIKSHLTQYRNYRHREIPDDWIVEEISFAPNIICEYKEYNAKDFHENQ